MEAGRELSLDIDVDILPDSEREVDIGKSMCYSDWGGEGG